MLCRDLGVMLSAAKAEEEVENARVEGGWTGGKLCEAPEAGEVGGGGVNDDDGRLWSSFVTLWAMG